MKARKRLCAAMRERTSGHIQRDMAQKVAIIGLPVSYVRKGMHKSVSKHMWEIMYRIFRAERVSEK